MKKTLQIRFIKNGPFDMLNKIILLCLFCIPLFSLTQTLNISNNSTHTTSVDETYSDLTAGNSAILHVIAPSTLTITGNATLNNGLTIIIDAGASLLINGCLSGNNNFDITTNGIFQIGCVSLGNNGDFIVSGSGDVDISGDFTSGTGTDIDIQIGGELTVTGDMTITSGTSNIDGDLIIGGSYLGPDFSGDGTVSENGEVIYPENGSLPIKLSYFEATNIENGNSITWITSSENNSSHFLLRRSLDGINWEDIVNKKAAGNSNVDIKYNFIDLIITNEVTYYELQQFDLNGEWTTYGPISVVSKSIETIAKLDPNPSSEVSYLTILNCPLGAATITLMSTRGEIIYTERLSITKSDDSYLIDALDLSTGSYIVNFMSPNDELITVKLVKN